MSRRGGRRGGPKVERKSPDALAGYISRNQRHIERGERNARKYGITTADYLGMLEAQRGRCGICYRRYEMLVIDHDHETGEVRGLLCSGCNTGLGLFRDDPTRLANAVIYLRRPPASF